MDGLPGDEERRRSSEGQQPHGSTRRRSRPRAAPRQGVDGVHDRQETVNADTRQQQHGAIHVAVESRGDNSAHETAVDPVVAMVMVGDLEGKEQAEQQVSTGQVQHVNRRRFSRMDLMHEHHHGDEIEGHANNEDESVNGRDKGRCQATLKETFGFLRDKEVLLGVAVQTVSFSRFLRRLGAGAFVIGQTVQRQVNVVYRLSADCFKVTREGPKEGH